MPARREPSGGSRVGTLELGRVEKIQCDRDQRQGGSEHQGLSEPLVVCEMQTNLSLANVDKRLCTRLGKRLPEEVEVPRAHTWRLAETLFSARLYILGHIASIDSSSLTLLLFLFLHHKNLQKQVLFQSE